MSIIIDPKWTLIDALKAAWAAYPGGKEYGAPNRVRSLERWANVVGRERATYEIKAQLSQYPSLKEAAKAFGMSVSTLRRIRKNFEAMPVLTPFSQEPSRLEEQLRLLTESREDTEIQSIRQLLELMKKKGINPIFQLIEIFSQEDLEPDIYENTLQQFLEISQKAGVNVIARLIDWITTTAKLEEVISVLENINYEDLQKLNTFVGLSNLKNVMSIWQNNTQNNNEEFWQKVLSQNSFIFAQLFSFPVILLEEKAYVGGKFISNTGGNIVDFLCTNHLTKNIALVEIKTPATKLLGSNYRGDIYNISSELSGSIIQVSNYKNSLLKNYNALTSGEEHIFDAFNPKSIVIIGNIQEELVEQQKKKSFELFRMSLNDIQVITYDELFWKVEFLINLLEGNK